MLFLCRNYELVKDREKTYLTSPVAVAATTLTVKAIDVGGGSVATWADNDWVIVGEIGTRNAEILQLNGSPSSGTSITIDNAGSGGARFAHSIGEPVYRIDYNQIQFLRATTTTGSKTTLATNPIQPDDEYTRYEDTTNTTGYGFVRFYNSASTAYSSYSDAIPYSGFTSKSVGRMMKMVRRRLGEPDYKTILDEDILEELNEQQRDVAHERMWPFYETVRSASTVAYQRKYDVDTDVSVGKAHTVVWRGNPLARIDVGRFEMLHWDTNTTGDPTHYRIWENYIELYPLFVTGAATTTLAAAISTTTATSVTLTSVANLKAPGRILVDDEVIAFEYIDSDNGILYGCTRGAEGTTAATHLILAAVTERDLIYTGHEEPTELVDQSDETKIPDPDVIVNGACASLAIGKLKDQVLHDRFVIKKDKGLERLRDKFGKKGTSAHMVIKDKDDYVRDTGSFRDPNSYPQNFTEA